MWLSTNYEEGTMIGASGSCSSSTQKARASHSTPSAESFAPDSLSACLSALIDEEGTGSWPPKPARAEHWPSAWRAYHDVAWECPPRFVDSCDGLHPQRSEEDLRPRIDANRTWLADQLNRRIDVDDAVQLLRQPADGDLASARLGFLACLAYLAHLYRWGTLPVVSLAQDELELPDMPSEIRRPMERLHEGYGLGTTGGCEFPCPGLVLR